MSIQNASSKQLLALVAARDLIMDQKGWTPIVEWGARLSHIIPVSDTRITAEDIWAQVREIAKDAGVNRDISFADYGNARKYALEAEPDALQSLREAVANVHDVESKGQSVSI